jgi:hypothetical protein
MGAARFDNASRTAPKTAMRDAWAGPAVVRHVALAQLRVNRGRERFGCFGAQRYRGRECARCNEGYYPWFDDCEKCPDPFGWTAKNALTVVYRYGTIWLLWMVINRILYVESVPAIALAATAASAPYRLAFKLTFSSHGRCDQLPMADSYALSDHRSRMAAGPAKVLDCGGCSVLQASEFRSDRRGVRRVRLELAK